MSIQDQIAEQDTKIKDLEKAHRKAMDKRDKAERTERQAEEALRRARNRRHQLKELAAGKKPYLCGRPYTETFHGDQYKTTTVTGIHDEEHWWDDDYLTEKLKSPYPYAYIVALDDDGKTWKALVYLKEDAEIKAATLRKLLKLPEV